MKTTEISGLNFKNNYKIYEFNFKLNFQVFCFIHSVKHLQNFKICFVNFFPKNYPSIDFDTFSLKLTYFTMQWTTNRFLNFSDLRKKFSKSAIENRFESAFEKSKS